MSNTYCSHTDCYYRDCTRHQDNAPKDRLISIADLDDGFCFIPEPTDKASNRERLLAAICVGLQNTHLKCDNPTRAVCGIRTLSVIIQLELCVRLLATAICVMLSQMLSKKQR